MSSGRWYLAAAMLIGLAACSGAPPQQAAASQAPPAVPSTPPTPSTPSLPPLPQVSFPPARPMPIVEAVFRFAAEHPDVLSHIPCFCGCENRGHKHNDDCFVAARDERGRVTAWEPHGIG